MRKRTCFLVALLVLTLFACRRKEEVSYLNIEGNWYLYAAYQVGSNVDILPAARALGYTCIDETILTVGADTFAISGGCEDLAMRGTYTIHGDSVEAYEDTGEPVAIKFDNGVLSTILNNKLLGDVDLRFQKKE